MHVYVGAMSAIEGIIILTQIKIKARLNNVFV